MTSKTVLKKIWKILGHTTTNSRAGHRSVRAGLHPFGYLTRANWVEEIPTRDSDEKMENRRASGGSNRGFLVGSSWVFWVRDREIENGEKDQIR